MPKGIPVLVVAVNIGVLEVSEQTFGSEVFDDQNGAGIHGWDLSSA